MSDRTIHVEHVRRDQFTIDIGGHRVTIDQPLDAGGDDTAPTPVELFVASLAGCVGFYARRYLDRHGLSSEGLRVDADFTVVPGPARVGSVDIRVAAPADLPPSRRAAFLAVASNCTVHHTLQDPPATAIHLTDGQG